MRIWVALAAACALLVGGTPASAEPRVFGGSVAVGNPIVVGTAYLTGNLYRICSASVWRPRILLTAAHCVTEENTGALIDPARIQLNSPGAPYQFVGGSLAARSPARVLQIITPPGFVQVGRQVVANDIAALVLDSEIGPTAISRLASRAEIGLWTSQNAPVFAAGYGRTSLIGGGGDVPAQVSLPLASIDEGYRGSTGWVINSRTAGVGDICSGDSGGPRWASSVSGNLLAGVIAGGSCGTSIVGAASFVPITYLSVVNAALAATGNPLVPSGPTNVKSAVVGTTRTTWWTAPEVAPEFATSYQVVGIDGNTVCNGADPICTAPVASVPAEAAVRSVNAQGEGDTSLVPAFTVLKPTPPRVKAKRGAVQIGVAAVDYPRVSAYSVRTTGGKQVCKIPSGDEVLSCTVDVKSGKHRYRVLAITPEGPSAVSDWSRTVRVK
jgi:hypothetical protein